MTGTEKRARIDEIADEGDLELWAADGFDDAIIGIGYCFNNASVVYDREKVISILMEQGDMSRDEAEEYFSFNVVGAYVGEATPVFVDPL
jgi:hypothetical protein